MLDALQSEYDFLVIGSGPAGLLAGLTLAGNNGSGQTAKRSIALIDKRDPWREPVSCAEAVPRDWLEKLVPKVDMEWVRGSVDGVLFVAPDGTHVEFEKKHSGWLIDRALMHKRLAEECQRRGVHCNFRTRVTGLSRLENGQRTLRYEGEKSGEIRARVVIDCSGPGSGFGARESIVQGNFDVEPAVFALVRGLKFSANYIQLFFGKNYAPGGYAWIFPRDKDLANVGLVVGRNFAQEAPARQALKRFLDSICPGAVVETFQGGAIPCGYPDDPLAVDNLYKAGDAANMVHPVSRAGIVEAMAGGTYAAQAALKSFSLENEQEREPIYAEYKARWDKAFGKDHRSMCRAKKDFMDIPDAVYNRAAQGLARLPADKLTMTRIFLTVMWRSPSLLWKMRGLFL